MQQHTIRVSRKTADVTLLRFLSPEDKLIAERELNQSEVEQFAAEVESGYRVNATEPAVLVGLGRRLYEWLDGAEHRWLAGAMDGASGSSTGPSGGMTLRIDVAERLRHLPWELLFANGSFLCFNAQRPFTPARR